MSNKEYTMGFRVDDTLGYVVNRTSIIMRKRMSELFEKAGYKFSPEEFSVISRLWEREGIMQTEIMETTLRDKTRVTRIINGLIEGGYIFKRVSEGDRRNHHVYLTSQGRELKFKLLPLVEELLKESASGISRDDINITIQTLRKVFENINMSIKEEE